MPRKLNIFILLLLGGVLFSPRVQAFFPIPIPLIGADIANNGMDLKENLTAIKETLEQAKATYEKTVEEMKSGKFGFDAIKSYAKTLKTLDLNRIVPELKLPVELAPLSNKADEAAVAANKLYVNVLSKEGQHTTQVKVHNRKRTELLQLSIATMYGHALATRVHIVKEREDLPDTDLEGKDTRELLQINRALSEKIDKRWNDILFMEAQISEYQASQILSKYSLNADQAADRGMETEEKKAEVDPAAEECKEKGGYSYTKENGCLSKEDYENKVANAKRKCENQEGYKWTAPIGTDNFGSCDKTDKQIKKENKAADEECKKEHGKGWEWDSEKGECIKTQKTLNSDCETEHGKGWEWDNEKGECVKTQKTIESECKAKGADYVLDNGECITKKEQCERQPETFTHGKKTWIDGKCVSELDQKEEECKAKGSDYVFDGGKCITKKEQCEKQQPRFAEGKYIWKDGKCLTEKEVQRLECKDKGKDYEWDDNKWSCNKKQKAQKRDCENTEGYFWSDELSRCIKKE